MQVPDVISAWDQFTDAIVNYKVVGLTGLLALAIWVFIAVAKRWGDGGPAPNWWNRMPRLGRTMLVASLGALAGVLASIQGGANPGQAIVVGFSGVLSILGHELAKSAGLISPTAAKDAESAPASDEQPKP